MSEEIALDAVGRRYPIQREIGRGGMSVVYEALDPRIGRKVAVKLLHPHLASRDDARKRFLQEATAIARLEDPHILKVYDYDSPDGAASYIVSELVEGVTLKRWVEDHPIRYWEVVALLTIPLFRALAHAHQQGIIHRDVKPENMMIRAKSGAPVLMDFGIAHIIDSETLTATGAVIGSPAHMAPEVVNGEPLTDRADLFSMGTVLYWMTCGSLPFVAPNPAALFRRILEARFDPIKSRRPEVPSAFANLVEQCMRRDPCHRPESATWVADRLEELLAYSGLNELDKELCQLARDPSVFQAHLPQILAPHYCESALIALNNQQWNLARDLIDRAYLFDPESPKIQQALHHIKRAMRTRSSMRFSVASLCAAIFGAGIMIWLGNTFSTPSPAGGLVNLPSENVTQPTSPSNPLNSSITTQTQSTTGLSLSARPPTPQKTSPSASPVSPEQTSDQDQDGSLKGDAQKKTLTKRHRPLRHKLKLSSAQSAREKLKRRRLKKLRASRTAGLINAKTLLSTSKNREEASSGRVTPSKGPRQVQRIKVSSRYKGAQVWVDGVSAGHIYQLDTAGGLNLTIGERHEIIFRSPFCEERREIITIERALPKNPLVVFECAYKPATLIIHSPQDAEVFLDGPKPRLLGRTNQVITYPLRGTGAKINCVIMNARGQGTSLQLSLKAGQRREVRWP